MASWLKHELTVCLAILIVALNIMFFPAIWCGKSMMSGALDASSIVPRGAYSTSSPGALMPAKTNDPGATAWFAEANYAFIHNQVIHQHIFPLWNPYNGCGVPCLANMQSQVLNPLQAIAWLKPAPLSIDLYLLSRLLCAGTLTFLFLRQFVSLLPAIFGGIAFMQCGYMMLYIGMPDISVCAFLPGLFWQLEVLLRRSDFRSVVLVSVFSTLLVYAGMPEVAFLALLLGGVFYAMRAFVERDSWRDFGSMMARYLGASLGGAMVAAPQILPFLEYVKQSFNAHVGAIEAPGMLAHANFLQHALNYFNPLIFGPLHQQTLTVETSGVLSYWGTITFFLAILGSVTSIKRLSHRRIDNKRSIELIAVFSTACFLLLIAKTYGLPLVHWIGALPVFKLIIYRKYNEPFIGFFVATLSAIGLNWISARAVSAKEVLACFSAFAALYVGLLIADLQYVINFNAYWRVAGMALGYLGLAGLICFLCARKPRLFSRYAPWLVATSFVELAFNFVVPMYYRFNQFAPADLNPYQGAPYTQFLKESTTDAQRVLGYDGILYPNWSSAFQLFDTRDLDALYPRRYLSFVRQLCTGKDGFDRIADDNLSSRFTGTEAVARPAANPSRIRSIERLWQLTSTKFILTSVPFDLTRPEFESLKEVYGERGVLIYKTADPMPRGSLFYDFALVPNEQLALQAICDPALDIHQTVVIEKPELEVQPIDQEVDPSRVSQSAPVTSTTLISYEPQHVVFSVNAAKSCLFMLNDTFYPGWNAYVDGNKTKVLHADYLFRGVFLTRGRHIVEFKYQPHWFYVGLLIAASGLILLGAWGTFYDSFRFKRR